MRTWDLNTPAARLRQAMKDLNLARRRVGDAWQDDKFREFQETFLDPLEPRIRMLITSLCELDEVLTKAERACGEN